MVYFYDFYILQTCLELNIRVRIPCHISSFEKVRKVAVRLKNFVTMYNIDNQLDATITVY